MISLLDTSANRSLPSTLRRRCWASDSKTGKSGAGLRKQEFFSWKLVLLSKPHFFFFKLACTTGLMKQAKRRHLGSSSYSCPLQYSCLGSRFSASRRKSVKMSSTRTPEHRRNLTPGIRAKHPRGGSSSCAEAFHLYTWHFINSLQPFAFKKNRTPQFTYAILKPRFLAISKYADTC